MGIAESMSRRSFVRRAGLASAAVAVSTAAAGCADEAATSAVNSPANTDPADARRHNTRLVLLGTAGGPTWWTNSDRSGISSAVVVGDAVYLVDCGDGVGHRYEQAGLFSKPTPASDLTRLQAIFLTHLHSDHVIDYPALLLFGFPGGGLGTPTQPVQVFGPGQRGILPAVYPPGRAVPPVISPENPWPGTVDMTNLLLQAFATDINDRIRDTAAPDLRTRVTAHDIGLPAGADADPNKVHAPRLASPIKVYEDSRVRVTATLVDHGQVFPSFAFRFDTDDGSITFSGDTTVCDNLIALAKNTDILVHEVVDRNWVEQTVAGLPVPPEAKSAMMNHLIGAHTTIEQVGPTAEAAGAKTLVLSHFGPANNPINRWLEARRGFSGRFYVGQDLMELGVGRRVR